MNKTILIFVAVAAGVAVLAGCASQSMSGSHYSQGLAQREMTVRMGVVDNIRQVVIDGNISGSATASGVLIGGGIGVGFGGGNRGPVVGSMIGAVTGAVAGHAIEQGLTKRAGLEITVRFDNGSMSAITQEADEDFKVGDRVRVLSGSGSTRVTH